jgi:hypothetical protein
MVIGGGRHLIFKSGRKEEGTKKNPTKEREREREREKKKRHAKTELGKTRAKTQKRAKCTHARTQTHKARAFVFKRPSHRNRPEDAALDLSCLQQFIILAVSWSPSGVLNPNPVRIGSPQVLLESVIQNY